MGRTNSCQMVRCYKEGEHAEDLLPGDFILTHTKGFLPLLVRIGQSFRFSGKVASFTHAALVLDSQGQLIEATPQGVKTIPLSKYDPSEYYAVYIDASDEDRQQMIHFALTTLNQEYSWWDILSIGLSFLTGLHFSFGFDGEQICSGLVAKALERGWTIFDRDANRMTPADLAQTFNIMHTLA